MNKVNPVITVNHVDRAFGSKIVLKDITLQVDRAETFGILGPSGSGKTTLVKLLTGIDEVTSGEVNVLGVRMPKLSMLQQIGYMAQSDALYTELSAKENLEFFASLYGLKGGNRTRRIGDVMELVNLQDHLRKRVDQYSGGMKRRLSLAIALLHEPPLLILDEPTVGIDPVLRQSIWKELKALNRKGTTIVLTTHVMDEAEKCDRLAMIRDGVLLAVDTPAGLLQATGSATIEEAFLYYGGVRKTMALMFIAPLLVLSLMSLVFNGDAYEPKIGVSPNAAAFSAVLEAQNAEVTGYDNDESGNAALRAGDIDAYITMKGATPAVVLEGSNPTANRAVMMTLQEAVQSLQPAAAGAGQIQPQISYLYGAEDMKTIDRFGPIMIGVFVFFFVFLIAGVSFLRERTTGTLERLLSTPLKRWEIVLGYVCGFGIFTIFQALLISWFSIQVLGIMMAGSFGYVLLMTLLLSMSALTLGTLLSAFAANELQMIQFIPLVIVPQIFLSGLFPLDTLPLWLQRVGLATPIYYGSHALMNIMIRGKGWNDIALDVFMLIGFSLLFMLLNVLALRKHRKM
ncbi:hypothetical protein KC345_g10496, partial [Hortaea werneckii]